MESFRLKTTVSVSFTFYGWVFGFTDKVQILCLERVKEEYKHTILNIIEILK